MKPVEIRDETAGRRRKRFILCLLAAFFLLPTSLAAAETPVEKRVDEQLSGLNFDGISEYWQKVVDTYGGFLPESRNLSFKDLLASHPNGLFGKWLKGIGLYLLQELAVNGKLLGTLIILTIFSMLLQAIQNAFEYQTVSKIAYSVIYLVLIIVALNTFKVAMDLTTTAIQDMNHFLLALMPLILALMATSGSVASVAFFHPLVVFLINVSGWLVSSFVLPLIFMSTLLHIVSSLTEHYKVTQLANLLRNVALGTLAVYFAVFLGVMSVQGMATSVSDGVLVKTAKFITGNFVPVVGRMFTDAADTVIGASALVKNTIGIAGLLILVFLVAFPAVKVFALTVIYNLATALLQPLGGGPVIQCLSIMAKNMLYIFAALAIVSTMFFLAVTIIIASGNMSLMMH